ncbi:MAG: EscU/YscU/HrcU family type III secretion system export apparatus switch protein [Acidimicrobiales bacterium]|nr:EscU/YscU/HrcU family type III secretion system export apparatus switch protein [Acidimicrobiales bacterium]
MARHDDKTEQPTARRLREARRDGMLPQSMEVPQALTLIAAIAVLPALMSDLGTTLIEGWKASTTIDVQDPAAAMTAFVDLLVRSSLLLVPLVAAISLAAVVGRALLGGIHFNTHQLQPKAKKLNPLPGIKNLFSVRQLGQLFRLALKLGALAAVAAALWDRFLVAVFTGPADLDTYLGGIGESIWVLLVAVLAVSLVAGALDGGLAVRRYRRDLRMSKQEVKEDFKQSESNPMVKQEVRARQRKMSRMRMMAEVARADVVLTNPTHLAVALRYEPDSPAPRVVAKGAEHMAARIRQAAAEAGVPVRENKPLARALYASVEIGELIPVQLYQAVAEVLAVVYRTTRHRTAGVEPDRAVPVNPRRVTPGANGRSRGEADRL